MNNAYCATAEYYYKPVREMPLGKGFADLFKETAIGNPRLLFGDYESLEDQ